MPRKKSEPLVPENTDIKSEFIDITCKLAAVIPTGEYQNIQPHYEISQRVPENMVSKSMDYMRRLLQDKIDADHERVRIEKIKKVQRGLRITEKAGKYYPHVTTIQQAINPIDFPEDKLRQYASRGSLVHAQIDYFMRTQEWKDNVLEIPGTKNDFMIVTKGELKLDWKKCNFLGFWEEYKKDISVIESECKVYNDQYLYCGTRDIKCRYKGELSILDWKTSSSYKGDKLDKYFSQLAAYAMCDTEEIKNLIVVPLNPTSKKGYDKPFITTDIKRYFTDFLQDRAAFKEIYNV